MHFLWSCASMILLDIIHKLLVHGHCSESGLNSLLSRSSRCPWFNTVARDSTHDLFSKIVRPFNSTTKNTLASHSPPCLGEFASWADLCVKCSIFFLHNCANFRRDSEVRVDGALWPFLAIFVHKSSQKNLNCRYEGVQNRKK